MVNKNNRIEVLDYIKGIAIILVVLGHTIQYGSGTNYLLNNLYFYNKVFIVIYSFHMPLFMLISGYLFYFSISKSNSMAVMKKKIKNLGIPLLSWSILIFFIFHKSNWMNTNLLEVGKLFFNFFFQNLWFLWALLLCSLIVFFVNKKSKYEIITYIAIFVLSFFLPDVYNLHLYKFVFPYFVIGYYFNRYSVTSSIVLKKLNRYYIFTAIFILFLVLITFFNFSSFIYTTGHFVLNGSIIKQCLINLYRYFIGFIGSILCIILFSKIHKSIPCKYNKIIAEIGRNSLGIYVISGYIFLYIFPKFNHLLNYSFINLIIVSITVLVASIYVSYLIKTSSLLSILFLGFRKA